jgi:hypothetical protein
LRNEYEQAWPDVLAHLDNQIHSARDKTESMKVTNIHSRTYRASMAEVGILLDSLASREDLLWPLGSWPAMRLDRALGRGARGGHGPIRYSVAEYEPGRRVRFQFNAPAGFDGYHEYRVEAVAGEASQLMHELRMQARGIAQLTWPLVFRPLHDALIEDSLATAAWNLGEEAKMQRWSLRVRFLRLLMQIARGQRRRHASKTT